ncbi:MAG: GGDEF domain-containing protein [Clostridiales bacterium]|nr:GGDEF domain-containing protein [Clostridiales bacterium]
MTPIIDIYAVTVADFIGIAILLVILVSRGWSLPGRKSESNILMNMLIMSVVNCIVDQAVAYFDGRLGAGRQAVFVLLYAGNFFLFLYNVLVGIFLVHMIIKHIDKKVSPLHFVFFWVVCIVEIILLIVNFFTPIVFKIDMNNVYRRGSFFYVFVLIGFLLNAYGIIFYMVNKIKNPALRYFPVIEFLMPIVLGLVVQTRMYGISLLPACFAASLAGIVISFQNECIYIDKLTGVYNRFELDRELKRLQKKRKETVVAYMLDLNGFKRINDDYSHEEGDQALIAFAGILTDVFGSVGSVIRFAGDEFVALVYRGKESDIELYKQKTAEAVEKYNETSGKPYKLSAAVGGRVFDFSKEDNQDLVVVIDKMMYKDKDDYYKDHKKER